MVYITSKVYQEIASFLGAKEAERGAILLGKDNLVSGIYFEDATTVNPYNFTPVFTNFSNTENVLGLVHSHPFALTELSNQDIFYITKQQFRVPGTKSFFVLKIKPFILRELQCCFSLLQVIIMQQIISRYFLTFTMTPQAK